MENIEWKPLAINGTQVTVSSSGLVRRSNGKIIKSHQNNFGYHRVFINGAIYLVHRLVLLAFVGEPQDKYVGCHNDGDKMNNDISNLRWDTQSGNLRDRVAHGTMPERRTISEETKQAIRDSVGESRDKLAARLQCSTTTVSRIRKGAKA